ncbi:MAG: Crp/Fnr family transcriptional regulator, partial [Sphingobacterium sp.]
MEEIRTYFETFVKMPDDDWKLFASKLIEQHFPKKSILVQAGKVENYLSFIAKGAVRFYIPRLEDEFTFNFSFSKDFVSAYDSFLTRNPSSYAVEAMVDTIVWRISYEDLEEIYKTTKI